MEDQVKALQTDLDQRTKVAEEEINKLRQEKVDIQQAVRKSDLLLSVCDSSTNQ